MSLDSSSIGPRLQALADPGLRRLEELPGPRPWPWIGNALQLDGRRFHTRLEAWARQYGAYYRLVLPGRQLLVLSDRAAIVRLLRERPDLVRRQERTTRLLQETGVDGLFAAEGEEWRKQRRLVMRSLTPEVVHNFFPTLHAMTERLRQRWQAALDAGRPVSLRRELKAFSLDVTIALAMGQEVDGIGDVASPLQHDIDTVFACAGRRLAAPFPYWRYFRLPSDRAADASLARLRTAAAAYIARARRRLVLEPERYQRPANMLEALVAARDEPGSGFGDGHVIGNVLTMIFAGEDTTATTLAWLLYFLSGAPGVAAGLAAEADAALGQARLAPSMRELEHLPQLEAALHEAMRLKPVSILLGLEPLQDLTVGAVQVPAGTTILCLQRHSLERESEQKQEQGYCPNRWLGELGEFDPGPVRLFSFGSGPRLCPGRYLALAQIRMLMSMLMHNFGLERVAGAPPVREEFTFTMTPDHLPVRLVRRTP